MMKRERSDSTSVSLARRRLVLAGALLCSFVFWNGEINADSDCGAVPFFESEKAVLTREEKLALLDKQFIISTSKKTNCQDTSAQSAATGASPETMRTQGSRAEAVSPNRLETGDLSTALDKNLNPRDQVSSADISDAGQGSNGKQEEKLSAADNDAELRRQIQELIDNEENPQIKAQLEQQLRELQ